QLTSTLIARRWSGVMGFTLDRLPIVGELAPGIVHAGAWCGHGVALSIASGEAVADLVAGRPSRWAPLPFARRSGPWLPPDPFRTVGIKSYIAALDWVDRISETSPEPRALRARSCDFGPRRELLRESRP